MRFSSTILLALVCFAGCAEDARRGIAMTDSFPAGFLAEAVVGREGRDCKEKPKFGTFPDALVTSQNGERLKQPFRFESVKQKITWTASPHSAEAPWEWNGSSIPRVFEKIFGDRKTGCHALASVVHDYLYQRAEDHCYKRKPCDRMYYYGVRAGGIDWVRGKLMYYAVRSFGRKSFRRRKDADDAPFAAELEALSEEEKKRHLAVVQLWIEDADPELEVLDSMDPSDPTLWSYVR